MRIHAGILLFILIIYNIQCVDLKLFVDTEVGTIQGLQADDGDYVMFLGVPYAQVNTSNPFGASLPYPRFTEVFQAFDDSAICPQIGDISQKYVGTLDCLRLNIYVPNKHHKNKLPILVFIHGGNFNQGYGGRYLYGPKYLVRHDIIVVTINYRVGPYGFLCADTPEIPGNQGIKDQYAALKWIHMNIEAFGGNPHKITAAGQSAGSMSIDFHILSKQPTLFHRAIMHSGTALYVHSMLPSDRFVTLNIANELGFKTDDVSESISFLAKTDPALIINATLSTPSFRLCVEKEYEGVFRMISEHPEISDTANVEGIDILAGFAYEEWLFGIYGYTFKYRFSNPKIIHEVLNSVFNFNNIEEIENIVQRFYLGDKEMSEAQYGIIRFLSDFEFAYSMQRSLEKYKKHKNTNIYEFIFAYIGQRNFMRKNYNITEQRATHADDLAYLFHSELNKEEPNVEDEIVINRMTTFWSNFVKYGNPTPSKTELIPIIWPRFTENEQSFLTIDRNFSVQSRPFHYRFGFWDLFYEAYDHKLKAKMAHAKETSTNNAICEKRIKITMFVCSLLLNIVFNK